MPAGNDKMAFELKEETISALRDYYTAEGSALRWPHVFALPAWLESWWDAFGEGYNPCLRSVHADGLLIGLAPLMEREGELRLIGSSDVCDYLDFIIRPDREEAFFQALLPGLKEEGFKRLTLEAQRPDASIFKSFAAEAGGNDFPARLEFRRENEAFELFLPGSWEDYLARLSKKQRHEVRRKLRRLGRETKSYDYHVIEEYGAVRDFIPVFFELLQDHPEKAEFLTPGMERYFRALIDNMAAAGLARFGLLEIDGSNAAAVLYFDYRERINLYNSGFLSAYRPLSAGLLSKVLLIKEAIERERRVYDFLQGREVYKSRLGGIAVPVYRVTVNL